MGFARESRRPGESEGGAPAQQAAALTPERLEGLTADESARLRDALSNGEVEKAAGVAEAIRLRDDALGRDLLAEIRAFRVDRLLDLLEGGGDPG